MGSMGAALLAGRTAARVTMTAARRTAPARVRDRMRLRRRAGCGIVGLAGRSRGQGEDDGGDEDHLVD